MAHCPSCDVEYDDEALACPLCGAANETSSQDPDRGGVILSDLRNELRPLTAAQRKRFSWELVSILFLSSIIVVFVVDLVLEGSITWSRYPVSIFAGIWGFFTIATFLGKKPIPLIAGLSVDILILLFLIDVADLHIQWFHILGAPITLWIMLCALAALFLWHLAKRRGMNILAILFLILGVICLGVDAFTSLATTGRIAFGWSLIVMISTVPIFLILVFIHYRLKRHVDLERFFHL